MLHYMLYYKKYSITDTDKIYVCQTMIKGFTILHVMAVKRCLDVLGNMTIQQRSCIIYFDQHDMCNCFYGHWFASGHPAPA